MKHKRPLHFVIILTLGLAFLPVQSGKANSFTVTNTNDTGAGSLRQAILEANTNLGADIIQFNIPGCGGVCVITPASGNPLPVLTDDSTTIDGYSQPGAAPATNSEPAIILIEIDGSNILANSGLNIISANNLVRGLAINRFGYSGIAIGFAEASGNVISGNYLGLDAGGTLVRSNGLHGAYIAYGSINNTIGGDEPAERNVIAGNDWAGVSFYGENTSGNIVQGNYIGLDNTGTIVLGNNLDGVWIYGGAHDNTVGGDTANKRNLISGNVRDGVRLEGGSGNVVSGNIIGLKTTNASAGNEEYGVHIFHAAQEHIIGGDIPGESNIISGNLIGVVISGTETVSNTIIGNYIGTNATGMISLGNLEDGVRIGGGAAYNRIGGDTAGERNLISGNYDYGVNLVGSTTMSNTISGNYIGVQVNGTAALSNRFGVVLRGAANNTIGGIQPGEGNLISGNVFDGIYLVTAGTSGNSIAGNYIGTDHSGAVALMNEQHGIAIVSQADNNTIGPGNLVSGNAMNGITLRDVTGTWIFGNLIGSDAAGTAAVGNDNGIEISLEATNNVIGGDIPAERNVISGNTRFGVIIEESSAIQNTISGNYIGTDSSGAAGLGNGTDGIYISGDVQYTLIGGDTTGERNVISGNGDDGVSLDGADDTTVTGNYIGVDASGEVAIANADFGMYIGSGAQNNTIGGIEVGKHNVISGNGTDGIYMAGINTTGNVIAGNFIGTNPNGTLNLGNAEYGLELDAGANDNKVGPGNHIAFNLYSGVCVNSDTPFRNTITQNSIFANTYLGIELDEGANNGILAPVITSSELVGGGATINGTSCPGCTVEMFSSPTDDGEGQIYLGATTANLAGNFTITVVSLPYSYLTATATDVADGTSEFSQVFNSPLRIFLPLIN